MSTVATEELIRFDCPACGKRLKSTVEHQGKRARCRCGERVVVPYLESMVAEMVVAEVVDPPASPFKQCAERWTNQFQIQTADRVKHSAPAVMKPVVATVASVPEILPGSQSFTLQYQAIAGQVWDATLEFVAKLPDLTVIERNDGARELRYRSEHFKLLVTIRINETEPGKTEVRFDLARDAASDAAQAAIAPLDLLVFTTYKTQALDARFKQIGGPGGAAEMRLAGIWKMVWGGLIGIGGLVATAMTDGQVLFYGAILTGGIMFITGAIQAVIGRNVE
jgi:hypothetical protein